MSREDFLMEKLYQSSIAIARTMRKRGIITEEELCEIDKILLEKYQPLLGGLAAEKQN